MKIHRRTFLASSGSLLACLFAPSLADGPLPEHYEPVESPVANLLSPQRANPLAIVWQFGYAGLAAGPSANVLTPLVGDADAMIPEYKAFLCDVVKTAG